MYWYDWIDSPIGKIYVILDEVGIKKVELFEHSWDKFKNENINCIEKSELKCKEATMQLKEYFQGKRKKFDLRLSIEGTEFRKKVWSSLIDIPYGELKTYGDIAEAIENPKAVRAVGQANRSNKIPIIIPCHRVIGHSGKLVGYAGNHTNIQKILIDIENKYK